MYRVNGGPKASFTTSGQMVNNSDFVEDFLHRLETMETLTIRKDKSISESKFANPKNKENMPDLGLHNPHFLKTPSLQIQFFWAHSCVGEYALITRCGAVWLADKFTQAATPGDNRDIIGPI